MLKITTLSENTADNLGLLAEWGLSILVETNEANVLLDTGQTVSVTHNAEALGIDLRKVDKIVLSHGHVDHTGGLANVLGKIGKKTEVIAHPDVVDAKFSGKDEDKRKNIALPFQLQELEKLGAKFRLSKKPVKITADIMTTGEVPMVTDFEPMPADRFYVKENQKWHADELNDDLALIINTKPGLIVVIGGCHLINSPVERVYQTIDALKELKIQKIGVSHCTGQEGSAIMAQELGERFFYNNACTRIDVTDNEIKVD